MHYSSPVVGVLCPGRLRRLKRPVRCLAGLALVFWLATGCQPFKPAERDLHLEAPARFSLYSDEARADSRWWESFGDAELNRLVDDALADNLTIRQVWARLRQSRALAVQAGAGRFPDLTASGEYLTGRDYTPSTGEVSYDTVGLGLVSTYEIDLWGRVRAGHQSARLQAEASRQDLSTAAMTVTAEVARCWVGIIAQRMQYDLLQAQLSTNRTLLDLVELRFRNAISSALDVYQQKQLVDNVLAEIPLVEQEEQLLRHQLAALLGKPPRTSLAVTRQRLPDPAPLPPTGLPADLLAARPDVVAAGLRLQAADWQIAQARANRLPALSLTGRAGYGNSELDDLFDNWFLRLATNLALPIVDGGRRRAEVDRTRAVADENLATYRNAVLTAVKEVEDALVQERKQREHIERLGQAATTARRALQEAGVRYRNGLTDYLPVLTQLLSVQSLERQLITKQANLLLVRVGLYRALGGSWADTLTEPDPTQPIGMNANEQ